MGIKTSHSLKSLQTQREKLLAQLKEASRARAEADGQERQLNAELKRVDQKLKELESCDSEPRVSEHALLRYLQRAKGIDLEAIASEILTPDRIALIKAAPNCNITVDSIKFVVKNGTVATTLDA